MPFYKKGGEEISNSEPHIYIRKLLNALLDGLTEKIKSKEYRTFIKQHEHFKYPAEVTEKIAEHNPTYTKVAQTNTWNKVFGRNLKRNEKAFIIKVANNQNLWLCDISQTSGKPLQAIYQNVSGEVQQYQAILNTITAFSSQPVVFQEGASYYAGIGMDSFVENGKIVLRPALSQQQIIFALVREIIQQNLTNKIAVEAVSYMVCRHLNFDTDIFTFGYLLELLDYDVSLKSLKDTALQDTITKETEVFIGYLNANLPFLQETSSNTGTNEGTDDGASGGTDINALVEDEKQENTGTNNTKNISAENITIQNTNKIADTPPYPAKEHTETICDIDFRIMQIIRAFMEAPPDKGINKRAVEQYGYTDTKMLPIRHSVAIKLFNDKREVYKLHRDNSEERIDSLEEIERHRGFFGITVDDWLTIKENIAKNSMAGEVIKIGRWGQAAAGVVKPNPQQNSPGNQSSKHSTRTTNERSVRQGQEGAKRHMSSNQNQKTVNAKPMTENSTPLLQEDTPTFNSDGSIVFSSDDISHNEVENHAWIDRAMDDFFEQTGYKYTDMPYFAKRPDFTPTAEMKKINAVMESFTAYCIKIKLKEHSDKSPTTGNDRYYVQKAIDEIYPNFNIAHIVLGMRNHWMDIDVPYSAKERFYKSIEKLRNSPKGKPKRPSPEDDFKRLKAKEDAKSAGNQGASINTGTGSEQSNQKAISNQNIEIMHIIDSYKKSTVAKPKGGQSNMPSMKQMSQSSKKMR